MHQFLLILKLVTSTDRKMLKVERKFTGFVIIGLLIVSFRQTHGIALLDDLLGLINSKRSDTGKEIRLTHYTGSDVRSAVKTSYSGENIGGILTVIDFQMPTVFYIHGFRESPSNESIQTVAHAYLRRGDHNFILIDWSDHAYDSYLVTLLTVKQIARYLATVLDRFVAQGFSSRSLHIVGHSMGAQIAGFIGEDTSFEIPRITGLDPASPGYYQLDQDHLNPSNAKFVDVIHTDGGLYGAYPATGTVDCYANGGTRPQPGCTLFGVPLSPTDLCAHWRSWRIWAESLLNRTAFLALKCNSSGSFLLRTCQEHEINYCGFDMPNTTSGKYYFVTNAASPFGKGANGIYLN